MDKDNTAFFKKRLEDDILYWFVLHYLSGSVPVDLYDDHRTAGIYENSRERVRQAIEWEWEIQELSNAIFSDSSNRMAASDLAERQRQLYNTRDEMIWDVMEYIAKEGWCMGLKELKKEMSRKNPLGLGFERKFF